jgi:cytochrome c oxidase assembly protein subunit 15
MESMDPVSPSRMPVTRLPWPSWRTWRVSPAAFRVVAAVAVWALALTIFSGAAVRLTGSGLGCPDWPACTRTSVVAPLHYHAWIEFGNRLINSAVTIASLGALVAALRRSPRRRDLTWLSVGLVVGLLAEVVVGGLTVEHKLAPGWVMAHFLLAMVFLADAVILHFRAALPDADPGTAASVTSKVPLVGRVQLNLSRLMIVALSVVVTLGTIVTSTGPHGGDPTVRRFHFRLDSVARLHGSAAEVFLAVALVLLWSLARGRAPRAVIRRAQILLAAVIAQAAVGYTQYLNGDPVGVVALHVAGASLLVIAALRFHMGLWARVEPATSPDAAAPDTAAGDTSDQATGLPALDRAT